MVQKKRGDDRVDIKQLFLGMGERLAQQAVKPNIAGYVPHEKQLAFHKGSDHLRAYFGGNRSGKTYSAVVEDIWTCTKTHPYKAPIPGQVRGRVVGVDFKEGVERILVPLFKDLVLPSMLINSSWEDSYSAGGHLLTFANGSFIEFLSYEQETEKFAGTSRHFIHYDEEPPKDIYNECQARLVDTEGDAWLSMTPLKGATWVFEDIYEAVMEAPDKQVIVEGTMDIAPITRSASEEVLIIEVGMNENPHISAKARERFLSKLDAEERAARSKGTFMTMGGRIFKGFSSDTHVIPGVVPSDLQKAGWQIYASVDDGWTNPTAWLWHAVAPENQGGRIITFGEHYQAEMTISDHSRIVHLKEQAWGLDTDNIIRVGDPAMHQHSGITGTTKVTEYAKFGVFISTQGIVGARSAAIERMQEYFKLRGRGQPPLWQITDQCVNFVKELKKLKWADHATSKGREGLNKKETVQKKNDHAFDSAKYFACFLPDLSPENAKIQLPPPPVSDAIVRYDEALIRALNSAEEKAAMAGWDIEESYY